MSRVIFFVVMLLLSIQSFTQERKSLNVGIGIPVFLITSNDDYHNQSLLGANISIEKTISPNAGKFKSFSINPGGGLITVLDNVDNASKGGEYSHSYSHVSLNAYTKFRYNNLLSKSSKDVLYLGAIAGFHLFTKTNGKYKGHYMFDPWYVEGEINKRGKDFFGSAYYGIFAGWKSRVLRHKVVNPAFEIYYYPNFVSTQSEKVNAIQLSVLLEIGAKKEPPE